MSKRQSKYKSSECWSCHKHRPVQSHHVLPLEYGGPDDGEKVDICADCHSILHKEANVYYAHGRFQDLDSTIPFVKGGFGERIRVLIAKVIFQRRRFESGEANTGEQRRMTQISWDSDQDLRIAHIVKQRMGFTSLDRAIKKLVFDKWMELNGR